MTPAPTTALITGQGGLPAALVAAMPERPLIAAFGDFTPEGLTPDLRFRVERLSPFLDALHDRGITRVAFAGAIQRPRLDPALIDPATAALLTPLLASMAGGDDAALRAVLTIFEEAGFLVAGVADIAPALIPAAGVLAGHITPTDARDAARATAIVAALGGVDVGQGAVVQQGLCLASEALPGTDAMLRQVAELPATLRPDASHGRGLFYKAPKPGQDLRIDLPVLGSQTLRLAAAAGLGGVVWQAGGVICLEPQDMVTLAGELGLFLWSRSP